MDTKAIKRAIEQIAEEKGIEAEKILKAVEDSIASAYKREYEKKNEIIRAKFDLKTGDLKFWQIKIVVDETMVRMPEQEEETEGEESEKRNQEKTEGEEVPRFPKYNPNHHILLEEAKKVKKEARLEDEIAFPLESHEDFGRIAAQTAKQVILQRIREAERDSVLKEFQNKEGEIVSGVVQRFERGNVYIDLGRATGIMFNYEGIPGEHYRVGERLRFLLYGIQHETKVPMILLSRSNPKFVSRLFAMEVPEVQDGMIEIKAIAREPGSRTKIAVMSNEEGIDPVGSCVGQRGTRVMAVSNELGQEKIDIIEWSEDPGKLIENSLSPAKVQDVEVMQKREARVLVPEDQLSLAIGKGGQNVRLAAKLTGWKIDVRSNARPEEEQEGGIAEEGKEEKKERETESEEEQKQKIVNEGSGEEVKEEEGEDNKE